MSRQQGRWRNSGGPYVYAFLSNTLVYLNNAAFLYIFLTETGTALWLATAMQSF